MSARLARVRTASMLLSLAFLVGMAPMRPGLARSAPEQATPAQAPTDTPAPTSSPTATSTATGSATPSDPCRRFPPPTQEPFYVEPVVSPTGALSQTIMVSLGKGVAATVESEAGTTTVSGSVVFRIDIPLLPDTTHHLDISGRVEYIPGCFYSLKTRRDRHGDPLVIVQRSRRPILLPVLWDGR